MTEHITKDGTFYVETLLSTKDVAELLKLTQGRIRQLLTDGELKGRRISGVWVIERRDVERFQKQRREL